MRIFKQIHHITKSIIAVLIASVLVPGGIVFAKTAPDQHASHGSAMHCNSGDCSKIDLSCMSHCVSSTTEDRGITTVLPMIGSIIGAPEKIVTPNIQHPVQRFARPGPEYRHSKRKQLLSVMKRE
ncbi:MAG: hypothetical protein NUV81_03045 [bacterium]|nr:hypothetical protein [bacterium]